MNNINQFFFKIFKSPSLIWKAGAGLMFIGLAFAILFVPSITYGLADNVRIGFGVLLIFYGLFRLITFYVEYKSYKDE